MSHSGTIISNDDKVLYVFGSTKVTTWSSDFPEDYHIGVNLDTGRVDEIKSAYPSPIRLQDLTDEQQERLSWAIPAYLSLKKGVLAITAKARAGKDSLALHVNRTIKDHSIVTRALAEPIYEVRKLLFGVPQFKDRDQLIMIGQGLRKEDPNIWIKVWLSRCIDTVLGHDDCGIGVNKFIVPDIRQPNEFHFFHSLGALLVKVVANEDKRLDKIREVDGKDAVNNTLLNDETESYIDSFDAQVTITNNYNQDFFTAIDETVIPELKKRGW